MTMAMAVGSTGKVYAFEPTPNTFRSLKRNLRLNRLENVDCARVALSDREGVARLHFGEEGPQNSLAATVHASAGGTQVETETLDRFAARSGMTRLDLIKADVEGAELLMLRGARATLARFRPHLVLEYSLHCAAFGYRREDINDFLTALGYVLFRVGDRRLQPLGPLDADELYYNVVAVHAESLGRLADAGVVPAALLPGRSASAMPCT
jgi:FkbM family methyltransferase